MGSPGCDVARAEKRSSVRGRSSGGMRSTERRDRQVRDFKNSSGSEQGTEVISGTEAQRQLHLGGERDCDCAGVRQHWSAKGHGIDLRDE